MYFYFRETGVLWVSIVLNPHSGGMEKAHRKNLLEKWASLDICPLEDADFRSNQNSMQRPRFHDNSSSSSSDISDDEGPGEKERRFRSFNTRLNFNIITNLFCFSGPSLMRQNMYLGESSSSYHHSISSFRQRTIFHRALDACNLSWDNTHLAFIMSNISEFRHSTNSSSFNSLGQPLWQGM